MHTSHSPAFLVRTATRMPTQLRFAAAVVVLTCCIGCSSETPAPAPGDTSSGLARQQPAAQTGATNQLVPWTVTTFGIGPVQAGMAVREVSAALSGAVDASTGRDTAACDYLTWRGGPPGVKVMTEGGRIARVEVVSGPTATDAGARIGDSEARIRELYGSRVSVQPHKYTSGRYLIVTPANASDSLFRLVFETEGERVTRFRSGRMPQVMYVEGCS